MATLTTTITESITLDHGTVNSTRAKTVDNIVDIYKRVVSCVDDEDVIALSFDGNVYDAANALDIENTKYIRITNLDGTNPVHVNIITDLNADGTATANIVHLLAAGQSLVLWDADASISCSDSSTSIIASLGDIANITLNPLSETVKCEVFAASTVVS